MKKPKDNPNKRRINIFDIFLILLVLVIAAGIVWYIIRPSDNGESATVYFTVEFTRKDASFADEIIPGAQVRDSVKGYYLGVVDSVLTEPTSYVMYNMLENRYETRTIEGLYTVHLRVRANGTVSERDITAEGQVIKIGREMFIKGKGFASSGFVIELSTSH